MKLFNNKVLVTGGGSGIGLGITERLVKEGNTVIICGRRENVHKDVAERLDNVITYSCDLSVEAERMRLYEWVSSTHPDVNVLVNNAGIQNWMHVDQKDFYEKAKMEIEINITAPLHISSLFLNLNNLETIINVTSGLAFIQISKIPVYCSTKAFAHAYTKAFRHMLKDRNMEVIEMIPPALDTDLGGKGKHDGQPSVNDFIDACFEQIKEGKKELTWGFSQAMRTATPTQIDETFNKLNP